MNDQATNDEGALFEPEEIKQFDLTIDEDKLHFKVLKSKPALTISAERFGVRVEKVGLQYEVTITRKFGTPVKITC